MSGGIFRKKEETTRRNNNIAALTEMNLDSQHFIQSVVDSYGAIVFQLEPPCMEEWMNRKDWTEKYRRYPQTANGPTRN